MDPIFLIMLAGALLAVAVVLVRLITSQWLKERLRAFLTERNVDSAVVLKRSAFETMLVEAARNSARTKLSDLERTLKGMEDVDLLLCSTDGSGEIRRLEKIKGQEGIEEPLDFYLDANDGLLIFE